MLKAIFFCAGIFIVSKSSAQLQSDFHCVGSGYDAGCMGFTDVSVPGSSPIVGWLWDFGNGTTSNSQSPVSICYDDIGLYDVCLTVYDANGMSCMKCKPGYLLTDQTGTHCNYFTGISNSAEQNFSLTYNPVVAEISITMKDFIDAEVLIYDLTGRMIADEHFFHSTTIQTELFSKGFYLYRIKTVDGEYFSGKILKE